jgi:hypothetical protein
MLINVHQLFKGLRLTDFRIELLSMFEARAFLGRIQKRKPYRPGRGKPESEQPASLGYLSKMSDELPSRWIFEDRLIMLDEGRRFA